MNVSLICASLVTQKLCEVLLCAGKVVLRSEDLARFCLEGCSAVLDDALDEEYGGHSHLHTGQ